MVTVSVADTGVVVMMNCGEVLDPAATVTDAGTVTLGSLLLRATTIPPAGAGPFNETVFIPVMALPPTTDVGYSEIADNASGFTVRITVFVTPPYVAEIVTDVFAVTALVPIVNVGETVVPAGTVTDPGTVTPGSLLASATTAPPAGALPFSVT